MERIASFSVNHLILVPGIYISRKDKVGSETITTIDIRVKRPNFEECMNPDVAHTIEHLGATYFRNLDGFKDKVVYFGPMGCLTGFYLVLAGDYSARTPEYEALVETIMKMFDFVSTYRGKIPGASPEECGNYSMMDLSGAQLLAANFIVMHRDFKMLLFEYPTEETKGGIEDSTTVFKQTIYKGETPEVTNQHIMSLDELKAETKEKEAVAENVEEAAVEVKVVKKPVKKQKKAKCSVLDSICNSK